jgi:hypothetical protein
MKTSIAINVAAILVLLMFGGPPMAGSYIVGALCFYGLKS